FSSAFYHGTARLGDMVTALHDPGRKAGIIVPDWDALEANSRTMAAFADAGAALGGEGLLVLSQAPTAAPMTALRHLLPKSCVVDSRLLSVRRLMRLCDTLYMWDGATCKPIPSEQT